MSKSKMFSNILEDSIFFAGLQKVDFFFEKYFLRISKINNISSVEAAPPM
jgi:hypothetical protein